MSDDRLKLIFIGTALFAVPSLKKLIADGHDLWLVVTQPDRGKGRGKQIAYSAVKQAALDSGIEVYQPENINSEESINLIKEISPDAIIVVAYGQLLKKEILSIPRHGCINIHASLLPHLRGAAPINWAIVNGDSETGVTSMLMDEGMDSGDILLKEKVEIGADTDAVTLAETLADCGATLLIKTLDAIKAGSVEPAMQDESAVTYAPVLTKSSGEILFDIKSAREIHDMVRGFKPWPGAYTTYKGKSLKILSTSYDPERDDDSRPGTVVMVTKESFYVAAKSGLLEVRSVQPQNKRALSAADFINGYGIKSGMRLGE